MSEDGFASHLARISLETYEAATDPLTTSVASAAVADTIACALAAFDDASALAAASIADRYRGDATAWLQPTAPTPAEFAALANGTAAHALDLDDVKAPVHFSAVLVPALLALGEERESTGQDLIRAYAAAYRVSVALGACLADAHDAGWHPTGVIGPLAAAAGCATLLGLDSAAIANACAIAASMAGGPLIQVGTMVKPLHCGFAASAGIRAARLAEAGIVGSNEVLEGPHGYLAAFSGGGARAWSPADAPPDALAPPSLADGSAPTVKPFSSALSTHPTIRAALALGAAVPLADLVSVAIVVDGWTARRQKYHRPATGLQGKFSLEYCAATSIVRGAPKLGAFTDVAVREPALVALVDRITVEVDETAERSTGRLRATLKDGSQRTFVSLGTGETGDVSRLIDAKLVEHAERAGIADVAMLVAQLANLSTLPSVRLIRDSLRRSV